MKSWIWKWGRLNLLSSTLFMPIVSRILLSVGNDLPEIVDLLLLVTAGCGADGIGAVGVDLGVGMGCGVDALDDLEMGGGGVVVGDERWGCPILYV